MSLDLSLYLVTDRGSCQGRDLIEVVLQAVAGGVSVVQLREKQTETREFVELARALHDCLQHRGVPLFINDRVDVALAVGAEGVHVGQEDMDPRDVRRLVGSGMYVGLSAQTEAHMHMAKQFPVDYIGLGPIASTPTKEDAGAPLGIAGFARLRALVSLPVVAIGAVNAANTSAIIHQGNADGVAVVSALCAAADPREAARGLYRQVVDARSQKDGSGEK